MKVCGLYGVYTLGLRCDAVWYHFQGSKCVQLFCVLYDIRMYLYVLETGGLQLSLVRQRLFILSDT